VANRNAERGRATREHLVDVAAQLFATRGYEDTSIETVLREAEVSRGSLYHHFPSKDALFWAVLERIEERTGQELAAASSVSTDAVGMLRAGALSWIRLTGDPMVRRVMLIDAPAVLGWERWRQFDEEHALGTIKTVMGAAADAGAVEPEHVDVFAHILLAAVNEIALKIARSDDQPTALREAEGALEEFLSRLLTPPAR